MIAVVFLATHGVAHSIEIDGSDTAAKQASSVDALTLSDLDGDGAVGSLDFNLFRDCYRVGGPGCEDADIDGNQTVDLADFGLFAVSFGGEVGNIVVPEPSTLLLVAAGSITIAIGRRRLRTRRRG